ncbi:MAG TPA: hypothetical protein VGC52_14410 [Gemmatimonadaceae bacterium]
MISLIAFRNIVYRPWRSALLFFGYGIGVAVMIVLLSVGEALLTQARDEKLVGGGEVTVLPQGLDVEVMKTGGVGGLFFSIDQSRFIYDQLLASPRLARSINAVAPQIDGRLLYVRTVDGAEHPVKAGGEIPSKTRLVRGSLALASGEWNDDNGDRRWSTPTIEELRHDMDHFHLPPDSVSNRETWAEWHYFNVLSADGKRWAFISFIVAGDVTSEKWGGSVTVTLREQEKLSQKFESKIPRRDVRFSTTSANLSLGNSTVTVLPDGNYRVIATAGQLDVDLVVRPAPRAYFPGASLGTEGFVSGYTVPGLRASATGSICVASRCERYRDAQAYHDHNWGVWKGVTWDWGAARAGPYTILYGRVISPDATREQPLFVYLVDSLGFRAVMRPATISYQDGRAATVAGRQLRVPSRATFADVRGADTLRVELSIDDAIATDMRQSIESVSFGGPYFIQMKGTATISGRLGGEPVSGSGTGFFETYR